MIIIIILPSSSARDLLTQAIAITRNFRFIHIFGSSCVCVSVFWFIHSFLQSISQSRQSFAKWQSKAVLFILTPFLVHFIIHRTHTHTHLRTQVKIFAFLINFHSFPTLFIRSHIFFFLFTLCLITYMCVLSLVFIITQTSSSSFCNQNFCLANLKLISFSLSLFLVLKTKTKIKKLIYLIIFLMESDQLLTFVVMTSRSWLSILIFAFLSLSLHKSFQIHCGYYHFTSLLQHWSVILTLLFICSLCSLCTLSLSLSLFRTPIKHTFLRLLTNEPFHTFVCPFLSIIKLFWS